MFKLCLVEIVRAASELLAEWSKTEDRYSSRPGSSQSLVDGRKRARMDAGSSAGASEVKSLSLLITD